MRKGSVVVGVAVLVTAVAGVVPTSAGVSGDTNPPVIVSVEARPTLVRLYKSNSVEVVLEAHVTDDVGVAFAEGYSIGGIAKIRFG